MQVLDHQTRGPSAAIASMTRRQAAKSSAWSAPGPSALPSPSSGASRVLSHSRSEAWPTSTCSAASSLVTTCAGGVGLRMPAWALTISPRAQKVMPSP